MKKVFNLVNVCALLGTILVAIIDYSFIATIQERGGFAAWKESNFLWDAALAYAVVWHILYALAMYIAWLDYKENKEG